LVIIIVGGPPNSGKSTLAESLARVMQNIGIDAEAVDSDPFSPTLRYIRGEITKKERDTLKRHNITEQDINDIIDRLKQSHQKHKVVIADAPGGISENIKPVYKLADYAIILCRDDKSGEISDWRNFLEKIKIQIIAIIISKTEGEESITNGKLVRGTLVGLDRKPIDTPPIRRLALILKSKLGL
jgi:MinD-like ATPase involved in chromosome partitioning or flagellar assembly